jgi:hypothetical protein
MSRLAIATAWFCKEPLTRPLGGRPLPQGEKATSPDAL